MCLRIEWDRTVVSLTVRAAFKRPRGLTNHDRAHGELVEGKTLVRKCRHQLSRNDDDEVIRNEQGAAYRRQGQFVA